MNATEKRLEKAGLYPNENIIVEDTKNVIICDTGDWETTEQLKDKVIAALSTSKNPWGGFRASGGHWYLEKNYDSGPLQAALQDHLGLAYYS